jgi:hypothetical protein
MKVQAVKIQLSDLDSSSSNKSHYMIRKVLKNGYCQVMFEKCYKGQHFFLSLQTRNSADIY